MAEQKNQQGVYLCRQGNVFGPFTRAQLEQLKRTGEYLNYSFIWDPAISPDWKPVNMPPAPPPAAEQVLPSRFPGAGGGEATTTTTIHTRGGAAAAAALAGMPATAASPDAGAHLMHVIVHDNRNALSGTLAQPSSRGFTFITQESSSTLPPFSQGSRVWVNILDEHTGQTENLEGGISQVASRDGKWAFDVAWEKPAAMLSGKMSFPRF